MHRLALRFGTVALVIFLIVTFTAGFAEAAPAYTVQAGDTLFLIARGQGTTVFALKETNGLTGDMIYPGQVLVLPGQADTTPGSNYTVARGDTLFLISKRFGITVDELKLANNLRGTEIYPGQGLVIPGRADRLAVNVSRDFSRSDLDLLARAVHAEARGEIYEGQVAVAAVILNRLKSPDFPKTIPGIIYEPWAFSCVDDGQINLPADSTAIKAVQDAINGQDPTYGALYYWNPVTATSKWVWSRPIITQIGNHVFAK